MRIAVKIGAMYRVKCTNRRLNNKVGVLVGAQLDRIELIPYTLMLDGRMFNFAKDELIPLEEV